MASLWRRAAAAVAASVLVPTLAAAPAQADDGDGKGSVLITMVDATGAPVDGQLFLKAQGSGPGSGAHNPERIAPGTYDFADLPVGRYGAFSMTPWSGMTCAGISPCDYLSLSADGPSPVSGAVTVVDSDTPARLVIRMAPTATVGGPRVVGQQLRATWSPQMATMIHVLSYSGAVGGVPAVQWLRNGVAIPGAVGTAYTATVDDVGTIVSARLSYAVGDFWATRGSDWSPRTVQAGKVDRSTSRTTVDVFRRKVVRGRSPGLRVDVTAGGLPATGTVRVTIGRHAVRRTLVNGSARIPAPRKLRSGRYRVVATYLGTRSYAPSRGTGRFRVVPKR